MADDFGVTLDEAVSSIGSMVSDGRNFIIESQQSDILDAERYYKGESDVPTSEGRSSAVKTEVRDAIRAVMPSVLRTIMRPAYPIKYKPTSLKNARYVEQQALYINQLFVASGGYKFVHNMALEALKNRCCPVKVYLVEDETGMRTTATGKTELEVLDYMDQQDIMVDPDTLTEGEYLDDEQLWNFEYVRTKIGKRVAFEAFPTEFFVNRGALDMPTSFVHGHSREVTVSEAINMGLECDDWGALDNDDPSKNSHSAATAKRRKTSSVVEDDDQVKDPSQKKFLLTEAYAAADLDGDGIAEKYMFYLGGTDYKYLYHEPVDDWSIFLATADMESFSIFGNSVMDVLKHKQDVSTSIMRGSIDNLHGTNNPRPVADPTQVDFDDLMNNAIGAPIKRRGTAVVDWMTTPMSSHLMLPMMQFLEKDAQDAIGVSKASRGLDPDAMQSTDKSAVMNTIQLGEGQVELMVSNLMHTGLIPVFKRALQLVQDNFSPSQVVEHKGALVPVDLRTFDPELPAIPVVGLGTQSPEMRLQLLNFILERQEKIMDKYGIDNPFTSLSQMYNTTEDLVLLGGMHDPSRYFNYISKEAERSIAQQMSEAAQQAAAKAEENQPLDPTKALMAIESQKRRIDKFEAMMDLLNNREDRQLKAKIASEELANSRAKESAATQIAASKVAADMLNGLQDDDDNGYEETSAELPTGILQEPPAGPEGITPDMPETFQ